MPRAKKENTEVAEVEDAVEGAEAAEEVNAVDVAIRTAFDDNVESDEETIKMSMLQAGCKIKAVSRLYNTFMIDSGQMASKEEKDTALDAALVDLDLTDEDVFNDAVENLATAITGASEQSAATLVRAWAKRHEVDCYVKPKGASRTDSFVYKFNTELISKPQMTEAECKAFIIENGTQGTQNTEYYFQSLRKLANAIYKMYVEEAKADESEAA